MINTERLAMAQAYAQLEVLPAFRDLLSAIENDVREREREAEQVPAEARASVVRAKFIAWQESKRVLTLIQDSIRNAKEEFQDAQEALANERRIEHDRTSRGSW